MRSTNISPHGAGFARELLAALSLLAIVALGGCGADIPAAGDLPAAPEPGTEAAASSFALYGVRFDCTDAGQEMAILFEPTGSSTVAIEIVDEAGELVLSEQRSTPSADTQEGTRVASREVRLSVSGSPGTYTLHVEDESGARSPGLAFYWPDAATDCASGGPAVLYSAVQVCDQDEVGGSEILIHGNHLSGADGTFTGTSLAFETSREEDRREYPLDLDYPYPVEEAFTATDRSLRLVPLPTEEPGTVSIALDGEPVSNRLTLPRSVEQGGTCNAPATVPVIDSIDFECLENGWFHVVVSGSGFAGPAGDFDQSILLGHLVQDGYVHRATRVYAPLYDAPEGYLGTRLTDEKIVIGPMTSSEESVEYAWRVFVETTAGASNDFPRTMPSQVCPN